MGNFFNYDNKLFKAMEKLADCLIVSVLWVVFSLPVFTMGASIAALYETSRRVIINDEGYVLKTFVGTFKENFFQCTKMWLIHLVAALALGADCYIAKNYFGDEASSMLGVSYYVCILLIAFDYIWAIYTMTYTTRFTLGIKDTLKNGMLFTIGFLPRSALILVVFIAVTVILYIAPVFILLMPAFAGILYTIILEKVYNRFINDESDEEGNL
ncbi:MAG: YesL family protein [Lachnospiraceae bacterium]|nr:YesL family protein [Lachnospiraceae bacterium]